MPDEKYFFGSLVDKREPTEAWRIYQPFIHERHWTSDMLALSRSRKAFTTAGYEDSIPSAHSFPLS